MINKLLTLFLLFFVNICFSQDDHKYSENEEVFLFGDNVKLRASPNVNSEVLELLPVGTQIKIKKVTNKLYQYNGIKTLWYLVDYNGIEGYIVGGLISLKKHNSFNDPNSFFVYNLSKEINTDLNAVNIRFIKNDTINSEIKIELFGNRSFEISNFDNRGLENVNDIIVIDNYSESCGIAGGQFYIICNSKGLVYMARTYEVGDGGMYHEKSTFTFPSDEGGRKGIIIYNQESGEMKDETTNWYITTSQQRDLQWSGIKLMPDSYNKEK